MLPSSVCGTTTETVGFVACWPNVLATWLASALGPEWSQRVVAPASLEDLCGLLVPGDQLRRHALLRLGDWTAVLTDGPTGTDLGMIPSLVARELKSIAIRATLVDASSERFPAVILEVFDPLADDSLGCRRSIAAANDGGRWIFEQSGSPFDFEPVNEYSRGRVRDRFTPEMLIDYLRWLGVPVDVLPDLGAVVVVEREPFVITTPSVAP